MTRASLVPVDVRDLACGCEVTDAQLRAAYHMTEAEVEHAITKGRDGTVALAPHFGYALAYHTHLSVMSAGGFPDLVLARESDHAVIYLELKKMRGIVRDYQARWLRALGGYLIRPCCLASERIEDILRAGVSAHERRPAEGSADDGD